MNESGGEQAMTSRNRLILACILLVSLGLVSTCTGNGGQESAGAARLAGTEWVLTSLYGRELIKETEITLTFEESYLRGTMTCNQYGGGRDSGRYTATEDGTLTLPGGLAVTVQLCSEPEGIMEQEAAYIEALRDAAVYRIVNGRLEISDASGRTTLVFEVRDQAASG